MINWSNVPLIVSFTYVFLFITALFLWLPKVYKIPFWTVSLMTCLGFGMWGGTINLTAFILILIFGFSAYGLQKDKWAISLRTFFALSLWILGTGAVEHILPGFSNLLVLNKIQISPDAIPFTLYLNFDKVVLGILILGLLHERILAPADWGKVIKMAAAPTILIVAIVLILSYAVNFVHFDPKIPSALWVFALNNLFFVCLAEEAFYRGFIQKYLTTALPKSKHTASVALFIAAALFGLSHHKGGVQYVILATIAGIGYGWIYLKTKRIEASILAHFSLNILHFLFFTYPALSPLR